MMDDMCYDPIERKVYKKDKATGEWRELQIISSCTTTFYIPVLPAKSSVSVQVPLLRPPDVDIPPKDLP